MASSKLSISVKDNWLSFIEEYQKNYNIKSRSEVLERGLAALKQLELQDQYHLAYKEWFNSDENDIWDLTTADGIE